MKKAKQTPPKNFPVETQTLEVDLFPFSFLDDEEGVVINLHGAGRLMAEVEKKAIEGWEFDSVEINEDDESLFLLHFSKIKG